jgi:disulfide bond formation protein DsbB
MIDIKMVISVLALLTLLSDIFIVLFLFLLIIRLIKADLLESIVSFCRRYGIVFSLIIATVATSGSLFLSEVAKLVPCELCWFQRIFMYPQVLILAAALAFKDRKVWRYILPLCLVGGAISVYHYYIQMFPPQTSICSLDNLESCSVKPFTYYGYITIPLMALTASIMILIFSISTKRKEI